MRRRSGFRVFLTRHPAAWLYPTKDRRLSSSADCSHLQADAGATSLTASALRISCASCKTSPDQYPPYGRRQQQKHHLGPASRQTRSALRKTSMPSWNFRSVPAGIKNGKFQLQMVQFVGSTSRAPTLLTYRTFSSRRLQTMLVECNMREVRKFARHVTNFEYDSYQDAV